MYLPEQNLLAWEICLTLFHFFIVGFTCLRLGHRWRTKQMWWDDYSACIPLTVDVLFIILTWLRFRDGVAGIPEMGGFVYSDWFGVALGWTVIWGSRISLSLSIARVFPAKNTCRRFLIGVSIAFFLSYLASLLAAAVPCRTTERPWYSQAFNRKSCIKKLGARVIPLYLTFLLDLGAEILLLVTPLVMLWRVKLPTKERRLILALFASSVITLLTSITFSIIWGLTIDQGDRSVILIAMLGLLQAGLCLLICSLLIITMFFYRFVLRKCESDVHSSSSSSHPVTTEESTSNKNETNDSSAHDSEKSNVHAMSLTSIYDDAFSGISSFPPAPESVRRSEPFPLSYVVGEGEREPSSQTTPPPWSFSSRSSDN